MPSGFTALDYITISSLDERLYCESMVGASDVVYLDHQFEVVPTWSSGTNPDSLYLWHDDYRGLALTCYQPTDSFTDPDQSVYLYEGSESDTLTTERVLLCMPNSAYSVNGVIYPSTVLSSVSFNVYFDDSNPIQSLRYRIYGCYVLDVFDWRHYMVPCLRVSDGREGLYDLVDAVFIPILYPNAIAMSRTGEITSTYPVASELTLVVGSATSSISTSTVAFPKGSSSVTTDYRFYEVKSITPTYDDAYYYITDVV